MGRVKDKRDGYTLIEVLISMFVFGVGIMAILAFLAGSVKYMSKLNRISAANQFSHVIVNFLQQQNSGSSYLSAGVHNIDDSFISTVMPDSQMQHQLMRSLPGLTAFGSRYIVSNYVNQGKEIKMGRVTLHWKGGKYVCYFVKE